MFLRLPLGMLAAIFSGVPSTKENIQMTEQRITALTAARQQVIAKLESGHSPDLEEELGNIRRELRQANEDLATFQRLDSDRN